MHWWLTSEDTHVLGKRSRLSCVCFSLKALEMEIQFSNLGNVSETKQPRCGRLQKENAVCVYLT